MATRQTMWDRLGGEVDLLVVGGGINGAGIARDAARRGLSVAVVEARDLAYGTSSRSSKLVHGGLRYLEQFEFSLVFESVSERRILQDIAPHLVNPLGFLFPVYQDSRRGLTAVTAGMWIYEGLSLFRSPKRHRTLKPEEIAESEPLLNRDGLKGAPLYYDCSTDDARLTLETALDAIEHGAVVATWARVVDFLADDMGRITGARVADQLGEGTKDVRARVVVNATGPWTDLVRRISRPAASPLLRPTKGVHIVVPREALPINNAVVCFHPTDKRVLFAIPWGDRTYLGTTDTDYEGRPEDAVAEAEDVEYLVTAADEYFPDSPISTSDVIATWAGLRPLMRPAGGDELAASAVSREHQIVVGEDGLITIAGGKLTTYRKMSAEVVDTVVQVLRLSNHLPELADAHTDTQPLPGAVGWPDDDDHDRVADQIVEASNGRLGRATALLFADTYGMRGVELARRVAADPALAEPLIESRPEVLAQVSWGVEEELAATLTDVFVQRTQVFYRDVDQGLGAAERVAEHMGALLGWDPATVAENVERYRHDVERSRAWRR